MNNAQLMDPPTADADPQCAAPAADDVPAAIAVQTPGKWWHVCGTRARPREVFNQLMTR